MDCGGAVMIEYSALDCQPAMRSDPAAVSFLVTSYNKAAYLPAVLDSVLSEAHSVGIAVGARAGRFQPRPGKIAWVYERELQPIIDRRARPF
jgi:hypothetical protein